MRDLKVLVRFAAAFQRFEVALLGFTVLEDFAAFALLSLLVNDHGIRFCMNFGNL